MKNKLIIAGAGTGKTVAALHRLKFLSANPNAKILFTTYTRTLKENLEDLIKKMDINQNRCTLSNIDQVLIEIAKQYKIKDGYKVLDYSGNEESIKLWREVLETEVTEFDEQFLYDEYIDVLAPNTKLKDNTFILTILILSSLMFANVILKYSSKKNK